MAAASVIDPDVRWRLKIGEYIAKRKVSLRPPFSYTWAARPRLIAVCPSYSWYAINYSIEHFAGYYGLYFGPPPLDNASTGSGSPEAIAFVRLQYPEQTLSFLLRRQRYAPSLQTLA
jgi:hypothetical protein